MRIKTALTFRTLWCNYCVFCGSIFSTPLCCGCKRRRLPFHKVSLTSRKILFCHSFQKHICPKSCQGLGSVGLLFYLEWLAQYNVRLHSHIRSLGTSCCSFHTVLLQTFLRCFSWWSKQWTQNSALNVLIWIKDTGIKNTHDADETFQLFPYKYVTHFL